MSLTSGQRKFASVFAAETGLDPKVVGAWLLAEQSGSAAQYYQNKGYNNWLNIANTDSGPAGGAHSNVWHDPTTAAKASAEWIKGQGQIAKEYGAPASGIRAILQTAGQGAHRQIQAISRSGWASSGYHGGADLSALLGQTGNIQAEHPQHVRAQASSAISTPPQTQTSTFDRQGYEAAQQKAAGIRGVSSLFEGNKPGDALMREALAKAGEEPSEHTFTSSSIVKTPTGTYHTPATEGGQYVHPIPGAVLGRTDMGLDVSAKPGTPVRAIGDSKVTGIYPNWYQGQPYVELEFLAGPRKGQSWYAAEQIHPVVKPGQYIKGGHAIGYVAHQGTGIELGFGGRGGQTKAQREGNTGGPLHENSPAGRDFTQFAKGLH